MRFQELKEQATAGTNPVTGAPIGVKTPSLWDTIAGVLKGADKKKPEEKPNKGIPGLNPLKNMRLSQEFKGLTHQGVDLLATVGTPVYAPEDGVVKLLKGYKAGLYIELTTATGLHKFMHLSTYSVKDGAQVKAGTEIALTGNTGFSTGPHLHWEYWVDGKATNPIKEGALANLAGNALKKVARRQHLDFDTLYGKVFKITDNAGDPNNPGFSIVTPLNGEAWQWTERPEFKEIVKQRLNDPAFIGDHKYQQILDAMRGNKFDPAIHQMKSSNIEEGALADIAGNIWKKVTKSAEKDLPMPTSAPGQRTPIRGEPETTPRPTPVYDKTPKPTPVERISPFRGLIADAESAGLKLMPLPGGDKIVQLGGRPIVVVDVGGRTIPFYVSTGAGGKAGVPTGKWYPFFGIGPNGFFNKGWEEAQINSYYGNKVLAHVAQTLDATFGNVLQHTNKMPPGQAALGNINAGLKPFSYSDSAPFSKEEFAAYQKYINSIVDSI